MSGPSTLRLCFAAMAPALTEAASARLKLQDPGSKHRDNRTIQGNCNIAIPKADRLSPPRKNGDREQFPLCDLKTDGDRVDLTNGTHGDTVRSPPKGKGGGLNLTSGVVPSEKNKNSSPSITIGHFTSLTAGGKQLSSFIDGGGEDIETNGFLIGLKRMSQPYFTAANKDHQSVEGSKTHFNSSDTLRILASKVVSRAVMVNGDSGNDRKKEEEPVKKSCVRESGDAQIDVKSDEPENSSKVPVHKKGPLKFVLPVEAESKGDNKTMGMCEKDKIVLPAKHEKEMDSSSVTKQLELELPCEDVRKECVRKQAYLERKVEMLMRRLKRVKGKVVENHTKEQLVQYVNFQHRNLQMVAKSIKSEAPCPEMLKEHFLSNEDVKNMSTSQLVKLVRDHQSNKSLPITDNSRYRMMNASASVMSPNLQAQSYSTSDRLSMRVNAVENDLDSDATASSSGGESCDEEPTPCPPRDTALPSLCKRSEWKWAVDRAAIVARWTWLQAQVSDLEYKIRQQSQVHRQLRNSKGGVVLGDPPTAIDILRKLQGFRPNHDLSASTGALAAGEDKSSTVPEGSSSTEVSPYNITRLLSNVDKQASRLTQSLNCISPSSSNVGSPGAATKATSPTTKRGVADSPSSSSIGSEVTDSTVDSSPLVTAQSSSTSLSNLSQQQSVPELPPLHQSSSSTSSVSEASFQAARCRPLRSYRKRKILRTIDLYKTSVKAARLSDVRCYCYPPSNPCAMCGGRYNNTLPMDADNMSFNERVALLDPSFHSVLSFPQDIPLTVHCEGFLKSGLWQNKPQSKRSKASDYRRQKVLSFAIPESVNVKKSLASINNNSSKVSSGRGNSSTTSVIDFTTKIKNKYEGKTKAKKNGAIARTAPHKLKVNKVKKNAAKLSKVMKKKKKEREEEDQDLEAMYLEQEANGSSSSATAREDRSSNSASGSGLRDSTPSQRRRRTDNAFDINNIEIPHSIAASTRVEQIQYKEIVTPKWRVVEDDQENPRLLEDSSRSSATSGVAYPPVEHLVTAATAEKKLEKTNGVSMCLEQNYGKAAVSTTAPDAEEQDQEEDLSDEAFLQRHYQPEQDERKRFRTFLTYPPSRRTRTRSDAFLSMANTDTATTTAAVHSKMDSTVVAESDEVDVPRDLESETGETGDDNSMLSRSLPSLPLIQSQSDHVSEQQQPTGRRQSLLLTSASKRERTLSTGLGDSLSINHLRSSLSVNSTSSDPWPKREFPLQEDEYTRMQSQSLSSSSNCEPLHQEVDRCVTTEPSGKVYVSGLRSCSLDNPDDGCPSAMSSRQGSRAPSPHPSLESASSVGDDPTDPDWISSLDNSSSSKTNAAPRYRRSSHSHSHHNPQVADPDWTVDSDSPKKGKKR